MDNASIETFKGCFQTKRADRPPQSCRSTEKVGGLAQYSHEVSSGHNTSSKDGTVLRITIAITIMAVSLTAAWTATEAYFGFSLWDEGFLWYGVGRVMAGEVPIRDFMGYDLGRYYISAAILLLLGSDGIIQFRVSLALIQLLAVWLAIHLIIKERIGDNKYALFLYAAIAVITLNCWMLMPFKNFDFAISIVFVAMLAYTLQFPSSTRWFLSGVVLGLAAIIGRNHGIYGAIGGIGAIIYTYWCWPVKWRGACMALVVASVGAFIGFFPKLLMLLLIEGLARSFWDSIIFPFQYGATNLKLPIPWPWATFDIRYSVLDNLRTSLVGVLFLSLPLFTLAALIYARALQSRGTVQQPPVFIAAAMLSVPYTHYAYSRADLAHLALGIFPLLIGLFSLPRVRYGARFSLAGLLVASSIFLTASSHPVYLAFRDKSWRQVSIQGHELFVNPETADEIALLYRLTDRFACRGRNFVATPFWPGAYALMKRQSPIWEIYALFPRSVDFQMAEIARIQAADASFVIIVDLALDGRSELRYAATHPLIEQFIRFNFLRFVDERVPAHINIYLKRGAAEECLTETGFGRSQLIE